MDFSIVTYFWGNPKNIERFAESARKYTDDIVVAYIDLFDYDLPQIENVSYIKLDHSYLIDNGHGKLLQLATDHAKHDYVYFLHVGAEIIRFDKEFFEQEGQNYAVIRCEENGYEYNHAPDNPTPITLAKDGKFYSTKFIFHNKNYGNWNGNVHEGVRAATNENNELLKPISWYPIITWQRFNNVHAGASYNWEDQYYFENEEEKIISDQYRKMTRTKWVAVSKDQEFHGGQHVALAAYWEHKDAYEIKNRKKFIDYLLHNDMNKYNEGM
jgi:hypothetical protein